jgi:hypothetical protein
MGKCASCALINYLRKNWMSDSFENFGSYCQCILLMKCIIKNVGHRLNVCAIRLVGLDFRIFCMSQCKIIRQLLRYHGNYVVCVAHSPGSALNTAIFL